MKLYEFNGPHFTKRETFTDQPEAIAITMPERYFEETGGEENFHKAMDEMNNDEEMIWNQTISGIPLQDVTSVYLVFKGKVQYRLTIVDYQRDESKAFMFEGKIRRFPHKKWVRLCGPAVKAPSDFFMKGFQGFRYTAHIF